MKILAHVHALNNEGVIDQSVQALLHQSYPIQEIVLVDNGSTDGTLNRVFPKQVTVIRRSENLGPSGAVTTGLRYALAKHYDWLWVLDADSLPDEDALEKLVDLYGSFDQETKPGIGIISCSHILAPSSEVDQGRRLTPGGSRYPKIDARLPYCEPDCVIWSGCLFNLQAVQVAGLPRCGEKGYWEDLSADYGDMEYSYRIKQNGYRVLVHRSSIINHTIGTPKQARILGVLVTSTNHSAIRRYLFFRNLVYFWIYLYPRRNWIMLSVWFVHRVVVTVLRIILVEEKPVPKVLGCIRGIWDGLFNKMYRQPSSVRREPLRQ